MTHLIGKANISKTQQSRPHTPGFPSGVVHTGNGTDVSHMQPPFEITSTCIIPSTGVLFEVTQTYIGACNENSLSDLLKKKQQQKNNEAQGEGQSILKYDGKC